MTRAAETFAERCRRERVAAGLPERITDRSALTTVAALMAAATAPAPAKTTTR